MRETERKLTNTAIHLAARLIFFAWIASMSHYCCLACVTHKDIHASPFMCFLLESKDVFTDSQRYALVKIVTHLSILCNSLINLALKNTRCGILSFAKPTGFSRLCGSYTTQKMKRIAAPRGHITIHFNSQSSNAIAQNSSASHIFLLGGLVVIILFNPWNYPDS